MSTSNNNAQRGFRRRVQSLLVGLALGAWGATLYATLSFSGWEGDWGDGWMCGPWGCAPPLQALLACHLSWLVLLGPIAAFTCCRIEPSRLRWLGLALMVLATTGLTILLGTEALKWTSYARGETSYLPQRLALVLVSQTDLPIVQIFLAGTICVGCAWRR